MIEDRVRRPGLEIDPEVDATLHRLNRRQRLEFCLGRAQKVRHLMSDPRSIAAIDMGNRYLLGEASNAELNAAAVEAHEAWRDARASPKTVKWMAAWIATAAARDCAWDVARRVAWLLPRDEEFAAQRGDLKRMLEEQPNA